MLAGPRKHFINGQWVDGHRAQFFPSLDPATGERLAELARGDSLDIAEAVAAARGAFGQWQFSDGLARGRLLGVVAQKIRAEAQELARLESLDTGKPLSQARTDVEVASRYFEFYSGVADKIGGETIPVPGPFLDYTGREPLGVCAIIIPWNYPLQIGARAIAAPLAAGNTVVLKPAEEASLSVLELARITADAGFPPGVVNVVTGYGDEAGAPLASHRQINHLTFTGSVEIGKKVAAQAAANVVPVTLELGGKSPNIVFASADLPRAVPIIVRSILQNAGQTCSAGSRLLVEDAICDEVMARVLEQFQSVSIGPGIDDRQLGPLISAQQKARVLRYLTEAADQGLRISQAPSLPQELARGNFVAPTMLHDVPLSHALVQEEIFGPVVTVTRFGAEEEAIRLANGTEYGLVAAVWTEHVAQAHRVARRIHAGQVFVNTYGAGGGVEMPFGGYGQSGYGREKGLEALRHYTQVKNISVYVGD
ncbi:MAG: aldehyde dehydrogenase family protein [Thermaerobacter sp.]|nr:aldehyde dehydrogenase family protein [Thermaerobacter sp.]